MPPKSLTLSGTVQREFNTVHGHVAFSIPASSSHREEWKKVL